MIVSPSVPILRPSHVTDGKPGLTGNWDVTDGKPGLTGSWDLTDGKPGLTTSK